MRHPKSGSFNKAWSAMQSLCEIVRGRNLFATLKPWTFPPKSQLRYESRLSPDRGRRQLASTMQQATSGGSHLAISASQRLWRLARRLGLQKSATQSIARGPCSCCLVLGWSLDQKGLLIACYRRNAVGPLAHWACFQGKPNANLAPC